MSSRRVEIFCPKCQWHPKPADQWYCSCGNAWNTFETCGTCPECSRSWDQTQCLSCQKWSAHSDWYHEFIEDTEASESEEVIQETASSPSKS